MQGYTRIGDYDGDSRLDAGAKGYHFSTVAGANTYHQGIIQTVRESAFGVDPHSGISMDGRTAGIVDPNYVAAIRSRIQAGLRTRQKGEVLFPIYDENAEVVGYERAMAPQRIAAAGRDTHLGRMIGA
jgi:hypothetical protein